MKDIPYGDNFTVETCWMIKSTATGCHVSIHGSVPFVRSVISPIRMMIESSVMREMKDSISKLFCLLSGALVDSTSASLSDCLHDDNGWNEKLDKMLERKSVRAKLLALLQEGLEDADQKDTPMDTSQNGNSVPPQNSQPILFAPKKEETSIPWAEHSTSVTPQGTVNLLILVMVAVVLIVQLAILVLWLYPPHRQDGHFAQVGIPPNQSYLRESFVQMSQELQVLDTRLKALVQGVRKAMEYAEAGKNYENT